MPNPSAAVERFYAELARLSPRQWMSIITTFPVDEYERVSATGREALSAFAEASTDLDAKGALVMVQDTAAHVADDLWPDLATLRTDMRPHAAPGASELSEEAYDVFRAEASRRVWFAAWGVALAEVLTPAHLSGLYQPFEGLIPLSTVVNPQPDFERDLALALLTCSRWAVEQGPGSQEEKAAYWQTVFPRWMWLFNGGEMAGIGVPNRQISMALMTAISGFLPDGGAKEIRYIAVPLVREAELRVRFSSDEGIEEDLSEFKRWGMRRHERRWMVSRIVRMVEAMLTREGLDGTKAVDPPPESLVLIDRALKAMGFEPADREPPASPGGVLALPDAFSWWNPAHIDLAEMASGNVAQPGTAGGALPPPQAHGKNLASLMEPDHFNPAMDWYATNVLPFIDDYGPGPEGSLYPDIGLSRFTAAIQYRKQPERVRLFLWALADGLLVATQTTEANGGDGGSFQRSRLPLIRAIWWEEVNAATDAALGIGLTDAPPELEDPAFLDFVEKHGDAKVRVESAMRRFLKLPAQEDSATDELSALQIAMAARAAARPGGGAAASRTGCAASALPLIGLALTVAAAARALRQG